ncbi:MAG: efflux RND transporter permease subunit, partial [Waterburya sp.]
ALLPGSMGEFVGAIAVTVIIAVSSSLFISLTIIPALTARLHPKPSRYSPASSASPVSSSGWLQNGVSFPAVTRLYQRSLRWTLAQPVLSIFLALLIPMTGFLQMGNLEQQFFPAADRDQLQIELELSSSASLTQTETLIKQIRQQIINHPEVKDVHWLLGTSIPRFYYNLSSGKEQQANYAQALVQLNSLASASLTQKLQTELDQAFPTARTIVRQLEQGPPFDAPIEMRIYGSNLETLQQLGEQARQTLVQISDVTHTRASLDEIQPQLQLQVDEEQARLAGLDRTTIAQQLDTTLEGAVGGSVLEGTEELPVRVRLGNSDRANLSQISSLDLIATSPSRDRNQNQSLTTVPLNSLGKVQVQPELAQVTHYNGQRVNTIQGFITAGVLPADILSQFQTKLAANNFNLPPGYNYEFGGEAEEKNDAVGGLVST